MKFLRLRRSEPIFELGDVVHRNDRSKARKMLGFGSSVTLSLACIVVNGEGFEPVLIRL